MNSGMRTFERRYRAWANKDEDNSEEIDDAETEDTNMPVFDDADDMEVDDD